MGDDKPLTGCWRGNHFNANECSCPAGFASTVMSGGWASNYPGQCEGDGHGFTTVEVSMCYNASVPLSETIIGGTYFVDPVGGSVPNVYTKTFSCNDGFTAYPLQQTCVYLDLDKNDSCKQTAMAYMC